MITGFPSPSQGYEDKTLDLNSFFIKHPAATVFMQIDTTRYTKMGIFHGDILVIDRAREIKQNSLIVYESDGEFVLGRVFNIRDKNIIITGVITHVIHTVKEI